METGAFFAGVAIYKSVQLAQLESDGLTLDLLVARKEPRIEVTILTVNQTTVVIPSPRQP
jgi:hypothetical protein